MALADKLFIGIFAGIVLVLGVLAANMQEPPRAVPTVTIGETVIEVEIADSENERRVGLSNRDSLPDNHGMLFVFPEAGRWSFWMKDTRIPLDILWADAEGIIVDIEKDVQPSSYPAVFEPSTPALYVLEVPAGFVDAHGIAEGAQIVVQLN